MNDGPLVVLDASALMALLHQEPGAEAVEQALSTAIMSSVNWCEVAQKRVQRGLPVEPLRVDLVELGLEILPFTVEEAEAAAGMYQATRSFGLSLGDRACLALAQRLGAPAMTADRRWADVHLGVEVRLIR
ncbi:MAG: type II toxin-antitoxin system VapC family toxin [Dehalococcoidia bacterium]|nr:type II toxin-antitoxin system VapC family toxin [Dehalococcoidia bacterium]